MNTKHSLLPLALTLCVGALSSAAQDTTTWKFAFGDRAPASGWKQVVPTDIYSNNRGYGFEPGAKVSGKDYVTSAAPFLFSAKLPEGNYAVTALLNDQTGESVTTVKSEQRRLMLDCTAGHYQMVWGYDNEPLQAALDEERGRAHEHEGRGRQEVGREVSCVLPTLERTSLRQRTCLELVLQLRAAAEDAEQRLDQVGSSI